MPVFFVTALKCAGRCASVMCKSSYQMAENPSVELTYTRTYSMEQNLCFEAHLLKKSYAIMEDEKSLPCLHNPATILYFNPLNPVRTVIHYFFS